MKPDPNTANDAQLNEAVGRVKPVFHVTVGTADNPTDDPNAPPVWPAAHVEHPRGGPDLREIDPDVMARLIHSGVEALRQLAETLDKATGHDITSRVSAIQLQQALQRMGGQGGGQSITASWLEPKPKEGDGDGQDEATA